RQPSSLVLDHVLVPSSPPATCGNITAHGPATGHQWRKPSAIAHAQDDHLVAVQELVLAHRVERCSPSLQLAVEIGLCAVALDLAHARLVHSNGGVPRLLDQP